MKKAIFTDLGNVVVPFDHRRIVTTLFERLPQVFAGHDPEQIYRIMWLDEPGLQAYIEYETGRLTPEAYFKRFLQLMQPILTAEQLALFADQESVFIESRLTMLTLNEPVIRLWKNLIQDFPEIRLYALSNTDITCWPHIRQMTGIPFHGGVMSFETGFRKPDPLIFKAAIWLSGLPADRCFFTDDVAEFTTSARQQGMVTHHYDIHDARRDWHLADAVRHFVVV